MLWFSPTIIDIKTSFGFYNLWKNYKRSKFNFLYEEAWLDLSDYIYALYCSFKLYKSIKKIPLFKNLNISALITNELLNEIASPGLIKAITKYLFIKNLKKQNIKILKVINWHENQNIDRALNLAFKRFYPNISVFGYQGYAFPAYDAHKNPLDFEVKRGTIPHYICVISEQAKSVKLGFCKELNVIVSPALRFSYLHKSSASNLMKKSRIFLPLPLELSQCEQTIKFIIGIADSFSSESKIIVKCHPKYTLSDFLNLIPLGRNEIFEFTDQKVDIILGDTSFVISSASSVCMEAVAMGIPVAILANNNGLTKSPLPAPLIDDIWKIVYNYNDLKIFYSKTKKITYSNPERFFNKVNEKDVRKLFLP